MTRCFCGCGERAVQKHHALYQQLLRRTAETRNSGLKFRVLAADERNLVPVAAVCHELHHRSSARYRLTRLPDSVFEFAEELLGVGAAYEWLRRHYDSDDGRLDALLARWEASAASSGEPPTIAPYDGRRRV